MSNVRPQLSYPFSGSGPGIQTPDGCSVEMYRSLPYMGELEPVVALLETAVSVLELGCGTGRLTRRLVECGAHVTAVDNSAHMLAALGDGVVAVESDIESLNLQTSFDAVLLASCLINHPSPAVRKTFVVSAYRHLRSGGRLLLERHDPDWLRTVQPGPAGKASEFAVYVEEVTRKAELVHMALRFELAGQVWRQSFFAVALDKAQIEELLAEVGFIKICWHGRNNQWASGVVAQVGEA